MKDEGYSLFIGISHPSMPTEEITAILGLEPQHAHAVGEARTDRFGNLRGGAFPAHYWGREMFKVAVSEPPLSEALLDLVTRLSVHQSFFQKIRAEGGRVDLRIYWEPGEAGIGEFFSAELLKKLADVEVDISFTAYS